MNKSKSIILAITSISIFMIVLDTTVVNVAVGDIRKTLEASLSGLQWVIDGYALSFASLLLSAGSIADRAGSRRTFAWGLGSFALTSLLCGLAPSLSVLILARFLQGAAASLLIPSSLAILSRTFTVPIERARALAVWGGIGGGIAIVCGPVLGGLLTQYLGWRSVFLINVPVGLAGLLGLLKWVEIDLPSSRSRSLDLAGQLTAVATLAATTCLFIEGPNLNWHSPAPWLGVALTVAVAWCFFSIERKQADPMLPLKLFRNRDFSLVNLVGFALNFAFYGQLFFLNVYLQQTAHLSAAQSGWRFLPQTLAGVVFAQLAGRLAHRVAPGLAALVGVGLATLGLFGLAAFGMRGNTLADNLSMMAIGFSIGTPASLTAALLGTVERDRAGLAAGVFTAARQVGGLLGVAVLGSIVGTRVELGDVRRALIASAIVMGVGALGAAYMRKEPAQGEDVTSVEYSEKLAEAVA